MDLLLIVRDALASSLVTCLRLAMEARAQGCTAGVLFTEEALAALARGTFEWPRELGGQEMRLGLADRGSARGLPVLGRGEGRQLDVKGLVSRAAEAGVVLYACPIWTPLLALEEKLPRGLETPDTRAVLSLIRDAKRVVGSL